MIFVTVGSQKFQFNRLLRKVDALVEDGTIQEEVFAQTGYSDYRPVHYAYKNFLDREEFAACEDRADIIITHGGSGAIIGAVKKGKKVIAVPRLAKYGEHVDDHQHQLCTQFIHLNLILVSWEIDQLGPCVQKIKNMTFNTYQSHTEDIIRDIDNYLESGMTGRNHH